MQKDDVDDKLADAQLIRNFFEKTFIAQTLYRLLILLHFWELPGLPIERNNVVMNERLSDFE